MRRGTLVVEDKKGSIDRIFSDVALKMGMFIDICVNSNEQLEDVCYDFSKMRSLLQLSLELVEQEKMPSPSVQGFIGLPEVQRSIESGSKGRYAVHFSAKDILCVGKDLLDLNNKIEAISPSKKTMFNGVLGRTCRKVLDLFSKPSRDTSLDEVKEKYIKYRHGLDVLLLNYKVLCDLYLKILQHSDREPHLRRSASIITPLEMIQSNDFNIRDMKAFFRKSRINRIIKRAKMRIGQSASLLDKDQQKEQQSKVSSKEKVTSKQKFATSRSLFVGYTSIRVSREEGERSRIPQDPYAANGLSVESFQVANFDIDNMVECMNNSQKHASRYTQRTSKERGGRKGSNLKSRRINTN